MKNITPQEKAIELIDKFKNASFNCTDCDMPYCDVPCTQLNTEEAKQCALIVVNEIIDLSFGNLTDGKNHYCNYFTTKYYKQVKEEIEKL
jgi:hypothetical protein